MYCFAFVLVILTSLQKKTRLKPRPATWDSDLDGDWADQPAALIHSEAEEEEEDSAGPSAPRPAARGRGRGRGRGTAAASTRKAPTVAKKAPTVGGGRGKRTPFEEDQDEEQEDEDVIMIDDDDGGEEEDTLFVKPSRAAAKKPVARASTRAKSPPARKVSGRAPARAPAKQTTLNFSQASSTQRTTRGGRKTQPPVSGPEPTTNDATLDTLLT